jgi:hypothetical protein
VSLCVPLSPPTAAATATPLHLIKASVSTSPCLLAFIIVFLLHAHFCTLPKHPLLPHLPSCCSSHLHSAHTPLCLITASISASAFLLASLIDSLLNACHCTLPYHPTPPYLSSYSPSHFPATCALLCLSTASISASSTLLLSPPPLFCMHTAASHKSVHFHCLLITLLLWSLPYCVCCCILPQHPLLLPSPSCCSPYLTVTCVPLHIAIVSTPSLPPCYSPCLLAACVLLHIAIASILTSPTLLLFFLPPCHMHTAAPHHSIHFHHHLPPCSFDCFSEYAWAPTNISPTVTFSDISSVTLLLSPPAMASGVPLGSGGLLGYVKTYPYPYPTVTLPLNPRGLRYPC